MKSLGMLSIQMLESGDIVEFFSHLDSSKCFKVICKSERELLIALKNATDRCMQIKLEELHGKPFNDPVEIERLKKQKYTSD